MPRGSNFQKPYPPEFRREAVELLSVDGAAQALGIDVKTLGSKLRVLA